MGGAALKNAETRKRSQIAKIAEPAEILNSKLYVSQKLIRR